MKYLRKFENEAEYSAATLYYPSVAWVTGSDTVHFDKTAPTPPVFEGKYKLTLSDGSTVSAECDGTSAFTEGDISAYKSTLVLAEIGDCVASIDIYSFYECTNLSSCTIGNGSISIGNYAFRDCTGLKSINIGSGITSIGSTCFWGCSGLTEITVNATTPPTLGANAFFSTNCPIYVPSGSVDAYKSASGWSDYADRIQAIS